MGEKQKLREKKEGKKRKAERSAAPAKKVLKQEAPATSTHEVNFFTWLLGISQEDFFDNYFEKEHLHCSHGSAEYFNKGVPGIISPADWTTAQMESTVSTKPMHFGTDLHIVRFDEKLKKRVSYRTEGVVTLPELKKCMSSGWSVRFLRPHEHNSCNAAFIAMMERYFKCFCGLNSYWTPAGSQGFAPHYDDVDVFLLQMEGRKEWRLYDPPEEVDYLSRHSSEDYVPEQFPKPKHTLILNPGDVLYMPRGMVHQGRTFPDSHSLHITFSANQMNSWADFFLVAARYSIETLSANNQAWRTTIPRSLFSALGAANDPEFRSAENLPVLGTTDMEARAEIQTSVRQFVAELSLLMTDETNMDFCTDEYAKETIRKMQPPPPAYSHQMKVSTTVMPTTRVRLVGPHACRLSLNVAGEAILYHNGENNVVCLAGELGMLRFEREFAPAIATLISSHPTPIKVSSLPFPDFEDASDIAENQKLLCETLRDADPRALRHQKYIYAYNSLINDGISIWTNSSARVKNTVPLVADTMESEPSAYHDAEADEDLDEFLSSSESVGSSEEPEVEEEEREYPLPPLPPVSVPATVKDIPTSEIYKYIAELRKRVDGETEREQAAKVLEGDTNVLLAVVQVLQESHLLYRRVSTDDGEIREQVEQPDMGKIPLPSGYNTSETIVTSEELMVLNTLSMGAGISCISSLLFVDSLVLTSLSMATLVRTYDLPPFAEVRIRTGKDEVAQVRLHPSQTESPQRAEIFGTELPPGVAVTLPAMASVAVFTCTGCKLTVEAPAATLQDCYATLDGAVGMRSMADIHSHLEVSRQQAKRDDGLGPRILFVSDSRRVGTSSYVKTLTQLSVRIGYHPILVDAAVDHSAFGYPGCVSLYQLQYPADVEEGLTFVPGIHTFMGSPRLKQPQLFLSEMSHLADVANKKMSDSDRSRVGGLCIDYGTIDAYSVLQMESDTASDTENPLDTLIHAIISFDIDHVFVVQSAWLRFKIAQRAHEILGSTQPLSDPLVTPLEVRSDSTYFKLFLVDAINAGVSPYTDEVLRRMTWIRYFYGTRTSPLQPETVTLDLMSYSDNEAKGRVCIASIGSADQQSMSTFMPMAESGDEKKAEDPCAVTFLSPSDAELSRWRLLAISSATEFEPMPDGSMKRLRITQFESLVKKATIKGFALVESVTHDRLVVRVGNGNINRERGVCFFRYNDGAPLIAYSSVNVMLRDSDASQLPPSFSSSSFFSLYYLMSRSTANVTGSDTLPSADGGETGGSVVVTFFTTTFPKHMPEQTYSVPLNVLPDGLSNLVQSVLNISDQKFDFLYKDEYIGTSLVRFLRRRGISFEELLNIEYTPALQAKEGSLLPHDDWVSSVRAPYLGNADVLLTGAYDHCVRLWEGENCLALGTFHRECVKEVALSPLPPSATMLTSTSEGRNRKRNRSAAVGESFLCVSCSKDGSIASWVFNSSTSQLDLLGSVTAHTDGVDSIHVSPDGRFVATASWDTTVKVFEWDQLLSGDSPAQTQKAPLVTFTDHTRAATCCRFSAASGAAHVFSAGLDGAIKCLDVEKSELEYQFMGDHPINGISIKPGSGGTDLVIGAFTDNRARLFDSRQREAVKTFSGHRQWLYAASWLWNSEEKTDNNLFATSSEDSCVRIFDLRCTTAPLLTLDTIHTDGILDVSYFPRMLSECRVDQSTICPLNDSNNNNVTTPSELIIAETLPFMRSSTYYRASESTLNHQMDHLTRWRIMKKDKKMKKEKDQKKPMKTGEEPVQSVPKKEAPAVTAVGAMKKKKAAPPPSSSSDHDEEYFSEEDIEFDDLADEEDGEEELDGEIQDDDDFEVKAEKYRRKMLAQAQLADDEQRDDAARREKSTVLEDAEHQDEQVQLLAQSNSAEELRDRIQETVRILSNFKDEREEDRDRSEYLSLLRRDLMDLYEYNDFLMDSVMLMFPPAEAVEFLEAMEKTRPTTIRVNTLKTKRRDLVQALVKRGMNIEPLEKWSKVGLQVFESNVPIAGTIEYLAGYYMLQAAASFLPVMALAPQEKERVLDMSAAPGGKTTYIAQLMKNSGVIFANDVSESRCKSLNANIQRLGVTNCIVTNYDGTGYEKVMRNFDRVLLDAPCTGTGIISRDKSIKSSKRYEDIQRATQLQRSLILSAIDACKVGGYVVYSTCSFLVEEDEAIVAYALTKRDVEIVEMGLPFGRPGFTKYRHYRYHDDIMHSRRYFPHVHNMDGFYVCKLKKLSNNTTSEVNNNNKRSRDDPEPANQKKVKHEVPSTEKLEPPQKLSRISIPPKRSKK
eukprot:gene3596-2537_t